MAHPLITLTTDFGTRDGYVAAMKGSMLSICPQATLVDISHDIAPQHVAAAAFVLQTSYSFFPPGTVHLVVVDPGVGTTRRALAIAMAGMWFVGPDNGVFDPLWQTLQPAQAYELTADRFWRAKVSATFHGRDIFGPVAALLAGGIRPQELGRPIDTIVPLETAAPQRNGTAISGSVVYIDHFGNCITNITTTDLGDMPPERLQIRVHDKELGRLCTTYGDVAPGTALALIGSSGHLEIAVRDGNASQILGLTVGIPVAVAMVD